MIDEFTKESLFIDVAGSIRGKRVVEVQQAVAAERGHPTYQRSDNGLRVCKYDVVGLGLAMG